MAFVTALIGSAIKFVVFMGVVVAGLVCGAKFKDSKKAKAANNE